MTDAELMRLALEEAERAAATGDVSAICLLRLSDRFTLALRFRV